MFNAVDLNQFKYAQLQSSIFNKSNSTDPNANKFNLKFKLSSIENAFNNIHQEILSLSTQTQVHLPWP